MPVLRFKTTINAPADIVFDLARSIDLHKISTARTGEEAVAGTTSGLIGLGETVTWRARHLGLMQQLTSRITAFDRPFHFTDEMTQGPFKRIRHDHTFTEEGGMTIMSDVFAYESPFGIFGLMADTFFLKKYMQRLLAGRNAVIKEYAEDVGLYSVVLRDH